MCPEKPGKQQINFAALGNVLEFYKIRKCPGKIIACEKI